MLSWLFAIPRTVARQAPLSMGFPRQKYCSGLPFPSSGDLPDPGIEPALAGRFFFFFTKPQGKPKCSVKSLKTISHFLIGLFFWHWVVWTAYIFWKLILCQLFHCYYFPDGGFIFCFMSLKEFSCTENEIK